MGEPLPSSAATNPRGPRVALAALLALTALICLRYARFEVVDDAYISLRYARNLVEGHGLVFNVGERVEGYTNFLWVVLLALPAYAAIPLPLASKVLGTAFALLAVWATARLLPASRPSWSRLVAPALLAGNLTFALWAVQGLETALFTALVTLGVRADLRSRENSAAPWASAPWYALATLARPEGAVFFAAALSYRIVAERPLDRRAWFGPPLYLAVVGSHFLWRLSYYGHPLPNTFYAKSGLSLGLLTHGATYVAGFFAGPNALILIFLLPAALKARHDGRLRYLFWMTGAYLAAVALEGGDFFPGFRFLVPVYPLLYTLVQEGAAGFARLRRRRSVRPVLVATATGALALCLHLFSVAGVAEREGESSHRFTSNLRRVAVALREAFPPNSSLAANPIGALSFYTGFRVYDLLGLTDEHIAHSPGLPPGAGIIGHEKGDGDYVFARKPDIFLVGNVLVSARPPADFMQRRWRAWLKSEIEFVRNPELHRWYVRDWLPLSDGRYVYFLRRK
jgi:arabinofuranosyltransferase